jgi:hypothetical protein
LRAVCPSSGSSFGPLLLPEVRREESFEFRFAHREQLRTSAQAAANEVIHEAFVRRYWEIHNAERYIPWAEIDTVLMMIMESEGDGRPTQEGKNLSGPSHLAR